MTKKWGQGSHRFLPLMNGPNPGKEKLWKPFGICLLLITQPVQLNSTQIGLDWLSYLASKFQTVPPFFVFSLGYDHSLQVKTDETNALKFLSHIILVKAGVKPVLCGTCFKIIERNIMLTLCFSYFFDSFYSSHNFI